MYRCGGCGFECDRDENAAINLERYAMSTLSSRGNDACGEMVQQGHSLKQEINTIDGFVLNG